MEISLGEGDGELVCSRVGAMLGAFVTSDVIVGFKYVGIDVEVVLDEVDGELVSCSVGTELGSFVMTWGIAGSKVGVAVRVEEIDGELVSPTVGSILGPFVKGIIESILGAFVTGSIVGSKVCGKFVDVELEEITLGAFVVNGGSVGVTNGTNVKIFVGEVVGDIIGGTD